MKKILLMLVVLFTMSANIFADGLTATLQQGDTMTPYYGVNAFQEAYAAAQDGAIITLSSGKFNDVATVEKQISIIGSYAFNNENASKTILNSMTIAANNVKIEGVYFSGTVTFGSSSLKSIANCTLKRCWIETSLYGSYKHDNTLVDQCVIKKEYAMEKSCNYCIKNSTIGYFVSMNSSTNIAYISNCIVWDYIRFIKSGSAYITDSSCKRPFAIYKNNILGIYKTENSDRSVYLNSPSEFYNNHFCQAYMYPNKEKPYSFLNRVEIKYGTGCVNEKNTKADLKFNNFYEYPAHPLDAPLGSDGTAVGPYGGTGFSEYPAIPRIISKSIDSNSNAEGKINVKITVKAEQ